MDVGASDRLGGSVGNPNVNEYVGVSGLADVGGVVEVVGDGLIDASGALQILSQPPQ